jgi:GNAT superfamily N-acetyltransferase
MAPIRLRPAVSSELADVQSILNEATLWLRAQGIQQWQRVYPEQQIAAEIARGEVAVGLVDDAFVGTLTLLEADALWANQPDCRARYLHRFAVRRSYRGMGARMIDEACTQLAAHGIQRLRLDCEAVNTALRGYYERLGFEHRGDVVHQFSSGPIYRASRYERRIA